MWNLKKLNSSKQSGLVASRSWGLREREGGGQGYKLPVIRRMSSEYLMFSSVIPADHTVLRT